jgi:hypothetical protein
MDDLLAPLQERAKELRCLYRVVEAVGRLDAPLDEVVAKVLAALPEGWQYPGICRATLRIRDRTYGNAGDTPAPWVQRAPILIDDEVVGEVSVYYTEVRPEADEGPFLREERQLLVTLAERIGLFLLQRQRLLERPRAPAQDAGAISTSAWEAPRPPDPAGDWRVALQFLRRADPPLLRRLTRRMLNLLRWKGVPEVGEFFAGGSERPGSEDENRPAPRARPAAALPTERIFDIASRHCSAQEIHGYLHMWLGQDKVGFLLSTVEEQGSSLGEILEALERFEVLGIEESDLPTSIQTTARVALLRRFFTDQIGFINAAKALVTIEDFQRLAGRVLYPPNSHGKLGGKSAGLFLARKVVEASAESASILRDIRVPTTWYIASDAVLAFVRYNNMDDVHDRKYLDVEQVRQEYPHVVQAFKASAFPPELVQGLSTALDDFGSTPLIVRSSSLLEDRTGSTFSGKYKSLFLANQGSKPERLKALQDAIAEVYASMFGPDPIQYRISRNLLDVHEEMGIMIQAVVGSRVGRYFLPAFSGVAVSNNEFRWSPRIRREDGLVRLVPGLGTRAVDRLSDDYPVLVAPGQPGLRVNASLDEIVRYSPKMVDLIDLESNDFRTIPVAELLDELGEAYPAARGIVSLLEDDQLRRPRSMTDEIAGQRSVVTFEGLLTETTFVTRMATLLKVLQDRLGTPVDVEFASDGDTLYLLQCRAQSYGGFDAPPEIPRDLPAERVLFRAHRNVSNGRAGPITHVVYVDPDRYAELPDAAHLLEVGEAVGRLNKILPKRQFVLMGPGRWGSRGDIRLGVSVGYADISNTAMLIEIARQKGNYVPDLSFGTHFFQDLVEAGIRYLPLYPDEDGQALDEAFLRTAPNLLPQLVPDQAHLAEVVRVVDLPATRDGLVLRVLMNGDLDEAVGLLGEASAQPGRTRPAPHPARAFPRPVGPTPPALEDHWRWRQAVAERIAGRVDAERFGVRGMWLYGSTKNATARPDSDLDLLVHFEGTDLQRSSLVAWLEGWSQALAEANWLRTGVRREDFLDARIISTRDIEERRGLAAKIQAVTDAARPLPLGSDE